MNRPLFDSPWHRDPLLRTYTGLVVIVVLISTGGNVDLGGGYNPERAANVWNALVTAASLGFLMVALIPAVVRRAMRGPSAVQVMPEVVRPLRAVRSDWTDASALRSDIGPRGRSSTADEDNAVVRRAPELSVAVSPLITIEGEPVQLTWNATGADYVLIAGLDGRHDPAGEAAVYPLGTGDFTVTAVNDAGRRTARTAMVRVLPMPAITTLQLHSAPRISLRADVDVSLALGEPVLDRLDGILAGQRARTPAAADGRVSVLPAPLVGAWQDVRVRMQDASGWRPGARHVSVQHSGPKRRYRLDALLAAAGLVLRRSGRRRPQLPRLPAFRVRRRTTQPVLPAPDPFYDFHPGGGNVHVSPAPSSARPDPATLDHFPTQRSAPSVELEDSPR